MWFVKYRKVLKTGTDWESFVQDTWEINVWEFFGFWNICIDFTNWASLIWKSENLKLLKHHVGIFRILDFQLTDAFIQSYPLFSKGPSELLDIVLSQSSELISCSYERDKNINTVLVWICKINKECL